MPVRSRIHSSVVSDHRRRGRRSSARAAGTWQPRPVIEIGRPFARADHSVAHREGQRSAHRKLAADRRAHLAASDRPAHGLDLAARDRARRPGRTIRLKRTSSIPAKSTSLPRFSGCESTATAPHWASASTIFTPGMIGLPGKCPAQSSSVTVLRATTRSPGTSSSTSSMSRNGSRCGRIASIPALSEQRWSCGKPLAQPGCGRGGRSTWPFRPAGRSPRRSPRSRASNASFSATTVA